MNQTHFEKDDSDQRAAMIKTLKRMGEKYWDVIDDDFIAQRVPDGITFDDLTDEEKERLMHEVIDALLVATAKEEMAELMND